MSGTVRESPADFGNGDLISRLLAATPPYQTNSTFVPPGLYFSEMLKRFVQAKSCAAAAATAAAAPPSQQQTPGKRGRKRSWKDCGGKGVSSLPPPDQSEAKAPKKPPAEHHRQLPLWYPPFYPAAYPPPPVYFKAPEAAEPLDLQTRAAGGHAPDPVLHKQPDRHRSAFRVPEPRGGGAAAERRDVRPDDNRRGTSYLMGNLTEIFRQAAPVTPQSSDEEKIIVDVEGDGPEASPDRPEEGEKKNCKDLTALIGLELVVDYVKHGGNKGGDPNGLGANKCCQNS